MFLGFVEMTNWREKYDISASTKSTPKTPKSPFEPDPSVTKAFIRLVRITGICEQGLYLDDATILRELDAADLAELPTLESYDKQCWAHLLAHRLIKERLEGKGG